MYKKKAYVLIKVAAGKLDTVMRTLSNMPQVDSVEGVSGHCDVVAVVRGPDLETLQNTILSTIRGVDGIESTETWIVMVPQPESWTEKELKRYISQCDKTEIAMLKILAEKGRPMLIPELINELSKSLDDETYDIHQLTITLASITRRAKDEFRREELVVFDNDMGYFLNEEYSDLIKSILENQNST